MSNAARIEDYLPTRMDGFERDRLAELEGVISAGLDSFLEVGRSLMEIRDSRLYRESHRTFEEYCQQTWSIGRRHGNYLISAVKVADNLGTIVPIPNLEQARELAKVKDPAEQRTAWQEAIDTAPDSGMSARHIAEVVRNRTASPAPILPDDLLGPVSEILGERFEVYGTTEAVDMPWANRFCIYTESGFAARQLLDRVGTEIRLRTIDTAVLIVPSETETAWFHNALDRVGSVVLFRGKRMAAFVIGADWGAFAGLGIGLTVES